MKKIILLSIFTVSIHSYECKYINDFKLAGEKYNIDYILLCALGQVESKYNPYALNFNTKNNYDIGIMQINSWWFKKLKTVGMYDPRILFDYKYNIEIGSWIMKNCIIDFGISKQAIDCYNKGAKKAKTSSTYINKVETAYKILQQGINDE